MLKIFLQNSFIIILIHVMEHSEQGSFHPFKYLNHNFFIILIITHYSSIDLYYLFTSQMYGQPLTYRWLLVISAIRNNLNFSHAVCFTSVISDVNTDRKLLLYLKPQKHVLKVSYRKNSKNWDTLNYHSDCPTSAGLHPDPVLNIYGSPIPVVEEAKFLGLLFDKKLSFIPHIKALKAKCLKALDVLKVLSNTNWGGDRSVLLNLYRSLVRSKLDYGSVVYGSARKSYLKCLDTIHHQGLRLPLGAFRTSPVESLYAESNEPSLYTRREKLSLQYTTKLAANPKNPAHNCVFNPKYERFYNNTPSAIKPLGLRILPLLEQANISIKSVQPFSLPSKEPWTQNPPRVILDLHKNKKSEVDSHIFKTEFLEIKSANKHYMSIYTDGSKQDEKVACAVISPNFTDSIRLPDNSSIFTAEAKAIDIALYHIRDQPEKQFIIFSDSLSVLRSLKNLDHRNPLIQQIFRKYNYLSSFKEIVFCWLPSHTNIRGNELADLEAKSALSLSITNLRIPHSDFKSNIHQYVMNKCQSVWEEQTGNKLHELKPDFNSKCSFLGYSRQIQTKITRCRIGHTRLTHSYLLTNEQPPFCISCNEPFTVKHFLITCTEFNYIRNRYFTAKTVKELFTDISSDKIINFLKETNLFNKL